MYARTRFAFSGTSSGPTRDTDRTSTRLPCSVAVIRTAMSSVNPNHRVAATASMRPEVESAATTSQPMLRAAARAMRNAAPGGTGRSAGPISGYEARCSAATLSPP